MIGRIQPPTGRPTGGPIDLHSAQPSTHLIGLYQSEAELAWVGSGRLAVGTRAVAPRVGAETLAGEER